MTKRCGEQFCSDRKNIGNISELKQWLMELWLWFQQTDIEGHRWSCWWMAQTSACPPGAEIL